MSRAAVVVWLAAGCGATARSSSAYRDATLKVIAVKDPVIKACYDQVLASTPAASGVVTVTFAIEPGSGKLTGAKLDPTRTSAPDAVGQCVLSSLADLMLSPADPNRGEGTWMWSFTAPPPRS